MRNQLLARAAIFFAAAVFRSAVLADVSLAPFFRDGTILQRDKPLPVWGHAAPGERVRVAFHGQSAEATADGQGRWQVVLPPEKASSEPAELDVAGSNSIQVRDVLVGDVWLCGGQSNMEFTVAHVTGLKWTSGVMNFREEIAAANYPLIRQMKVPHAVADHPADDVEAKWVACSPATVGDFTAVGYFFARDLHRRLGIPIGLLNDNWGGTPIESWMSRETLQADPAADQIFARWDAVVAAYPARLKAHSEAVRSWEKEIADAKAAHREPLRPFKPAELPDSGHNPAQPAGLYNAMIHPFIPAAIRGFLWYQGEANGNRPGEYRHLFPEMIRQWRQDFGQGDLPFYFVQLANYGPKDTGSKDNWAFLREAQAEVLALPNTGMAVTIDIGNPDNVHPTYKQEVGRRLALWARSRLLGESVEYSGPLFQSIRREGSTLEVRFTHAEGLAIRGEPTSFEVAGEDRKFVTALARVEGNRLIVWAAYPSTVTLNPVAVRYAWRNAPTPCLFNSAGLPAAPFRSDTWPPAQAEQTQQARLEGIRHLPLRGTVTQVESVSSGTFTPPNSKSVFSDLPAFCRVTATLKPAPDSNIRIEVWLPAANWNGRLLGTGNGGGAGAISYGALAAGLKLGYATANTDLGTSPNAGAVSSHPDRWADFGHRATHEMTAAAKAIAEAFYGQPARRAYFVGASTGGQQSMVEAQSFPGDYDGIIAGCPAFNRTHLHTMFLWDYRALNEEAGGLLPPEKVALLAKAVIRACAGRDGGAPGDDFLTDPRLCRFDPETLLPPPGQPPGNSYLTAGQVAALKKIYAGATNPRTGERIFTPPPFGSELHMLLSEASPGRNPFSPLFYIFHWGLGPDFNLDQFDFDRDEARLDEKLAPILNANNPDLSGFRRRGGKLLMWCGTADAIVPFQDSVSYYERVVKAQGGLARTQEFCRFFAVPGIGHGGGRGPGNFGQGLGSKDPLDPAHNMFAALVQWVEQNVAPEKIIATAYNGGLGEKGGIRFQRPIYPYPEFPQYIGGDPASPDSFKAAEHERGGVAAPAERYLN